MVRPRRSSESVSRDTLFKRRMRSLRPMIRNPHRSWRAMLAVFSGKIPAWIVQVPTSSERAISFEQDTPDTTAVMTGMDVDGVLGDTGVGAMIGHHNVLLGETRFGDRGRASRVSSVGAWRWRRQTPGHGGTPNVGRSRWVARYRDSADGLAVAQGWHIIKTARTASSSLNDNARCADDDQLCVGLSGVAATEPAGSPSTTIGGLTSNLLWMFQPKDSSWTPPRIEALRSG